MTEKGQTGANCNLENTNRIANEVGEGRDEEKGNSHIGHAKDFQNAIDRYERTAVAKCVAFYHHLQEMQLCQPPDSTPLTQHITLCSCNFLFSRLQGPPTGTATSRRNLSVPLSHLC